LFTVPRPEYRVIHPQPPHPDAIRRAVMTAYGRNDAVLNARPYI